MGRLKAELSELRHEGAVLVRTEQILRAKDPTPEGLVATEAALEKASVEKSAVDKAKGKTLDEISAIVQKINAQLKDKKNKLAPQIKALRAERQAFQQVEVKSLESHVTEAERNYHEFGMQLASLDTKLQRAH